MMKTRHLAIIAAASLAAGCAATETPTPDPDPTPIAEVIEKTLAQSELGRSSGYYVTMAQHWMAKQLPAKGGCHRIGESSKMYLRIEASGTVSGVYGDPETERIRCYRLAYTGLSVPRPPAAPFYMSLDIG